MGDAREEGLTTEPDAGPLSRCDVSVLAGHAPITVWTPVVAVPETTVGTAPGGRTSVALCLAPERVVVVGRSDGRTLPEYLDPAYRPTTLVPDSGQSVLLSGGQDTDVYVSRAHFMLRGAQGGGVVYTNGVPRRGGGIRPPVNGTWLISPDVRLLDPGEEVLIERGMTLVIRLPNRCHIQLSAR